ncbi:MAG TPA: AMP-binding protein [Desulfobacterales bacterium]|nr:AMP-binding protein [Desulfobacterales bacterium]
MALHDFTFYDLINRNAVCFKNLPAWLEADDGRRLSFGEFKDHVDRLAAGLRQAGVQKGDRIGVLGKNSLEYFMLYGAAAAIGAIVLPINWRLSAEEVIFNLNDGTPKLLFADSEYQSMTGLAKERLPSVQRYFNLKPPGGGFDDFNGLLKSSAGFRPADVTDADGLVIIHTAAVAGRPRGALLTHRNLINANVHLNLLMHLSLADVHLNILPLFHVGGLFMATMAFHAGVLNLNMSKFDGPLAAELIETKGVTVMFDFAPILGAILEQQEKTGKRLDSLKHVIGLEAPATIEKYQKLTGGTFYVMYGQTETSAIATLGRYNDRPGSAGRTIPLADVKLVDDNDRVVPAGQVGEIAVKGPMVFSGYWNLPEDTAQTFRGGWHHTGDLGRFDEDGFLFYAGRKPEKELIKPGGENVYPAEVEKAILEHPAVEMTVVFGVPDPKWKEGIKAVCQLKAGQKLAAKELIKFVGERIASYKKPQQVDFVAEMPLLANGSPDRAKVKEQFGGAQKQ